MLFILIAFANIVTSWNWNWFPFKKDCAYFVRIGDVDNIRIHCNDESVVCSRNIWGRNVFHSIAIKCNIDMQDLLTQKFPNPSCSEKPTFWGRYTADQLFLKHCGQFPFFQTEFRFLQDDHNFDINQYKYRNSDKVISNIDATQPFNLPVISDNKFINLVNVGNIGWFMGPISYQKVNNKLHIHVDRFTQPTIHGHWSICSSTKCSYCTKKGNVFICEWTSDDNSFVQYDVGFSVKYLAKVPFTFIEKHSDSPIAVKFDVTSIHRAGQQTCQLPVLHFTAPYGSMNDPSPVDINGVYHLFYQHRYEGRDIIGWGHAKSTDLLHWEDMPTALKPCKEEKDSLHLFAGTVIPKGYDGKPTIFYTSAHSHHIHYTIPYSHGSEKQNMAVSYDNGNTWVKKGLLISGPTKSVTAFRDPFVFQNKKFDELFAKSKCSAVDEDTNWWYMTVASGIREHGGQILLYRTKSIEQHDWQLVDLPLWTFASKEPFDQVYHFGFNWEVANVFPINHGEEEYFVLTFGTEGAIEHFEKHQTVWAIGKVVESKNNCAVKFIPVSAGLFDHGSAYAINTFDDSQTGKRVAFAFIVDDGGFGRQRGAQIIPRELSLGSEIVDEKERIFLAMRPALQFRNYYKNSKQIEISNNGVTPIGTTAVLELKVTLDSQKDEYFNLFSLYADEQKENVHVQALFNPSTGSLIIDRKQENPKPVPNHFYKNSDSDPELVIKGKTLRSKTIELVVIIDHSVIEVFANNQTVITFREYSGSCITRYLSHGQNKSELKIFIPEPLL